MARSDNVAGNSNHSGDVWKYVADGPIYYNGQTYPVAGFYDAKRSSSLLPFHILNSDEASSAFPDGAIWPSELQDPSAFSQQGAIHNWDADPEFLDGDFFSLKDLHIGPNEPNNFIAPPALAVLADVYKFWIAYADIDGYRLDTVKHMGLGPTRYFVSAIHEFAMTLNKSRFLVVGEITGSKAFETVEATGLDAALGVGGVMETLWRLPRGEKEPEEYFDLFRNAPYHLEPVKSWLRNRLVTMLDDHDQVWKGGDKARFCATPPGTAQLVPALALNLCTLGIPCIYYGSEQAFDGSGGGGSPGHAADQWIRECMFGGGFGAFRTHGMHFFDENGATYKAVAAIAAIRARELALTRGRQYLREISGDGVAFGVPQRLGEGAITSVVAWSRVFDEGEVLCAISTDVRVRVGAWVTVDAGIQSEGRVMECLYPEGGKGVVVRKLESGRCVVWVEVGEGGFVMYK